MTSNPSPVASFRASLVVSVASLSFLVCACGGNVGLKVKDKMLKQLSVEARIDLLDPENSMFAAIDMVDQAHDELENAEEEYEAANDRINEAKEQRSKAKEAKDSNAVDVAELAIEEAKQHKSYIKAEMKVLRKIIEVREAELDVAHAKFELARANAVKAASIEGSEKLKIEDFQAQVDKLDEKAKKRQEDADAVKAEADDQKKTWLDSREALAKASGGAQGSAWVQ
jgi:chromosome segregation ATPase